MSETPEVAGSGLSRGDIEALVVSLTAEAAELRVTIAGLRLDLKAAQEKSAADLKRENAARRRSQRRTWVTIVLDVCLSLVSLLLWHDQVDTNHRLQESLNQNYITQQQQQATRVKVLCPLYEVLLGVASDPARTAGMTAAQAERAKAAVLVIENGYRTLGCLPKLP
jgi:hypothetical protein